MYFLVPQSPSGAPAICFVLLKTICSPKTPARGHHNTRFILHEFRDVQPERQMEAWCSIHALREHGIHKSWASRARRPARLHRHAGAASSQQQQRCWGDGRGRASTSLHTGCPSCTRSACPEMGPTSPQCLGREADGRKCSGPGACTQSTAESSSPQARHSGRAAHRPPVGVFASVLWSHINITEERVARPSWA